MHVCYKCHQPATVTVTLEGGCASEVQHNFKFGTCPLNYPTPYNNPAQDFDSSLLVDLLKNVPPLSSEELKAVLKFFVELKVIYDLRMVPGRTFMVQLLPRIQGRLLNFFGVCIRDGASWEECTAEVLQPHCLLRRN